MERNLYLNISSAKKYCSRTDFLSDSLQSGKFKLLDVGNLGDGDVNVDVKKIVKSKGGEYFGLDCNINLANNLVLENQFIGDLHDLSNVIESEKFDVIYSGQVIEHSWRPGEIIKECRRILKDDGTLILDTPNVFDVYGLFRYFFKKTDTIYMDDNVLSYNEAKDNLQNYRENKDNLLSQPQHKIFYSAAMLRQLLNMHGFRVEKFVFIKKSKNIFHKILLYFFPHGSQKIGVVARKDSLENIYNINRV